MTDNQTVKERLKTFIDNEGISIRCFERTCGLANGFVKNIRQSIQPDKLNCIAEQFPTLNPGWLITGEGEMLRSTTQTIGDHSNHNSQSIGSDCSKCPLGDQLREKDKQIGELQQMINKLMEKI